MWRATVRAARRVELGVRITACTIAVWAHSRMLRARRRLTTRGMHARTMRAMAACRIVAASDAAALRRCDGGRRPLPPAGEQIALKIASAMVAIALSAFPEPTEEEEESPEGLAAGGVLADGGTALARAFLAHKREVCAQSLAALAERIRGVKSGHARSELRGVSKAKQGAGVRRRSAKRGGAGAKERPKSAGFG